MGAVAYKHQHRAPAQPSDRDRPRLFALPGGAATAPTPFAEPVAPVAEPVAPVVTLDTQLTRTWSSLTTGSSATCPLCTGTLTPRHSANGIAGGRCTDCGTTIE